MSKILVLGASGFIGLSTAQALSRAGHQVYGLTRSAAKGKQLAAEEIIPIIGEADSEEYLKLIATLDVVIDTLGGNISVVGPKTFQIVVKAAKETRPAHAPKLTYIYTSGAWVFGDNRKEIVNDSTPITNPPELVAWRPAFEQQIINDSTINGVVIRPACVYGHGGSILAPLFDSALKGQLVWPGTPGGRYSVVHVDDLADLYVKVAEKAHILGGKIFSAANDLTESVDDILQKVVEISGSKNPYTYKTPSNAFELAFSSTVLLRPYLARALVGWQPKKPGLVDGLPTYFAAFIAHQQ